MTTKEAVEAKNVINQKYGFDKRKEGLETHHQFKRRNKMKITLEWLKEKNACSEAVQAWQEKGCEPDPIKIISLAMEMNRFDWANWLIVRVMSYKQYVSYAVFAAEQVIDIYEKKYPDDKRPRNAIEAAKKCIARPTVENKTAARAAAWDAAGDAWAAAGDAWAAAGAAWAAAGAAWAAARAAAWAAGDAAWDAWAAGAAAWDAAGDATKQRIIEYGVSLLREG